MTERAGYLTPEGLVELERELDRLRHTRRKEIADKIHEAKELGITVSNAEYDDAKREQSFVEGRIRELENVLKTATVVEHELVPSGRVNVGSKVTLVTDGSEQDHFIIVGHAEAKPLVGKISTESPVGKALLGKHVGDRVQVMAPAGVVTYTISVVE